jgi:Cu(I)/Ag(I) efflux system membrane fusion protein
MSDEQETAPITAPHEDGPEPVPPGTRAMSWVRWALIAASVVMAAVAWSVFFAGGHGGGGALYQCPMHPQIVSDSPGECPICFMALEPVTGQRQGLTDATGGGKNAVANHQPPAAVASAASPVEAKPGEGWGCSMCPEVHSDHPGPCPKCHMPLVPESQLPARLPEGLVNVDLSDEQIRAAGVRVVAAEEGEATSAVRANASVQTPEQTVSEVHVRAAGFVESVAIGTTGTRVRAGQLLLSVYSPEIYQAMSELLAARAWNASVAGSGLPQSPTGASSALGSVESVAAPLQGGAAVGPALASRRKLELLGVSSQTIDRVLAKGEPERTVGIVAPRGGFITKKNVVLGSYVTPEMPLYEIADLSKVWIVAELFEQDAALAKQGTKGVFRPAQEPAVALPALVELVYPQVSADSRTTRVRMTVDNRDNRLLPGAWGMVEFGEGQGRVVRIPTDAVVDTGTRQYVFVEVSPGHYSPRQVTVRGASEGLLAVSSGLERGERVVSGATFLIDSESRLRASVSQATTAVPKSEAGKP